MRRRTLSVLGVLLGTMVVGTAPAADKADKEPAPEKKPPATQRGPVVGVPEGWDLVKTATYTATQKAGEVTVVARGEHPTGGYETKLVQSPLRIWPPQYVLACKKPDGPATQVMSPFEVKATFKAKDPVKTVVVSDAAGQHEVAVEQAKD